MMGTPDYADMLEHYASMGWDSHDATMFAGSGIRPDCDEEDCDEEQDEEESEE